MRSAIIRAILAGLLLAAGAPTVPGQAPPELVNYQGVLLAENGAPETGPKTLEFRIVDQANAVVWGPQTFEDLPLHQGRFNVLLGVADNGGPSIATAFAGSGDDARYLSAKVAGDPAERLPLQRISSVPFALKVPDGSIGKDQLAEIVLHRSSIVTGGSSRWSVPEEVVANHWTPIPGFSMTVPVSGKGRPLVVAIQPSARPMPQPVSDNARLGDIHVFCAEGDVYFNTRLTSSYGESLVLRQSVSISTGINSTVGFPSTSVRFLTIPPEDTFSVTLTLEAVKQGPGSVAFADYLEMIVYEL